MGYDLDLAGAAREYNQNAASHLANIELAPQYAEAEAELQSYIDKSAYAKDNVSVRRLQVDAGGAEQAHPVTCQW